MTVRNGCILIRLKYWHVNTKLYCRCNAWSAWRGDREDHICSLWLSIIWQLVICQLLVMLVVHWHFFDYSLGDKSRCPPKNVTFTSIKTKASEAVWNRKCAAADRVPREEPHNDTSVWCCSYTKCYSWSFNLAEYHIYFNKAFSDKRLLLKHQFLIHYATCMMKNGLLLAHAGITSTISAAAFNEAKEDTKYLLPNITYCTKLRPQSRNPIFHYS